MARPPIVGRIVEQLVQLISAGEWSAGGRLPPTHQLAAQLHVSPPTVAAAVKQLARQGLLEVSARRPVRLAPGAIEKAQQLFKPEPRSPRPRRIAIVIPQWFRPLKHNPFYRVLVDHLAAEGRRIGVETPTVWWLTKDLRASANAFLRAGYDGAVALGFKLNQPSWLAFLYDTGFPLVFFNQQTGHQASAVMADLYGAAQRIAARLVKLGHRNICLATHGLSSVELVSRQSEHHGITNGWADYLEKQDLLKTCILPLYMPLDLGRRPGEHLYDKAFRLVMASAERPTAIVFAYNPWAREFLLDRELARLAVPAQLSLAVLETTAGIPEVPHCPPLTNLEINFTRTAQCLLEAAQKKLNGERSAPLIRVPLDMNLTESIGPPPDAVTP